MDTLRLKPRQPVEDFVENWDDDDFMIEGDDITFRSSSTAQNAGSRRESHSSFRSDFESIHAEEEQQVLLPGDDEKSTSDAIALAASAGIPLPKNVPPSALMGGTIKRLGGRKIKKIFQEDWGDDLELPDEPQPLRVKPQDSSKFPDALRQVSGGSSSPVRATRTAPAPGLIQQELAAAGRQAPVLPSTVNLDLFRDDDDDDDFFGDGAATIKVPKNRQMTKPISLITPPTPQKNDVIEDDFEQDLELPSNGKLTLTKRKEIPKTPSLNTMDDFEWGEGSLGTRFGGTRRDGRSNRSSSVSALSPSVSSSITAESEGEDDTFDGLVLPVGPVNFSERLQKRRSSRSPNRSAPSETPQAAQPKGQLQPTQAVQPQQFATPGSALGIYSRQQQQQQQVQPEEDLLDGFDLGDGDVFDTSRLTLHRNVRLKDVRPASPSRPKTAVSITFTNKTTPSVSRLPRPLNGHERSHTASSLEPVSESGGPIYSLARRSQSRVGHSAQSSLSSIPTPTTPSATQPMLPSTPRRREVGHKTSIVSLRNEPTTTNAQLLRMKRSLPAMRAAPSSATRPAGRGYERPPSRNELGGRTQTARPKTPVERARASVESAAAQARKNPLPFIPAGASQFQSHHVTAKTSRVFRRQDSETSVDRPSSRAVSRSAMRSPSPAKRNRFLSEKVGHEGSYQQLSKPRRLRQFGDGHELDGFDDLPTSAQAEAGFLRQPASASKTQMRSKMYQNILPDRTNSPSPMGLYSPAARFDNMPHFARDTAASRIARETSLAQRTPSGPLAPLTAQRVAQLSTRNNFNGPSIPRETIRSKKAPRRQQQLKPHLISNLGGSKESKTVNGMYYNPVHMRWEGNENALSEFEPPASSPSTASIPSYLLKEKEVSTPRPALITPIGATKGVQVVGGMVFDPQNMCWLKLDPTNGKQEEDDVMDGFNGIDSDEDVFKDIPDLEEMADTTETGGERLSDIKDDWLVGEEFDVGPEFVRRQREEEQRWKKKCDRWMTVGDRDQSAWRWLLREMVTHAA